MVIQPEQREWLHGRKVNCCGLMEQLRHLERTETGDNEVLDLSAEVDGCSETAKSLKRVGLLQIRLGRLLSLTLMSFLLFERLSDEVEAMGSTVVELAMGSAAVAVMASRVAFRRVRGGATGATGGVKGCSCGTACCGKAGASGAIKRTNC